MLQISRQELHEQVWNEPVARVAEKYHLSGSGLRKICLSAGIPVPPRGHWAKVRAGKRVKKPALRKAQDGRDFVLLPQRSEPLKLRSPLPEDDVVAARRAFEADPKNRIVVASALRRPHAWAKGVARQIEQGTPGYRNTVAVSICGGIIAVEASAALAERITAIVDALARAFERRKYQVVPAWPPGSRAPQGSRPDARRLLIDGGLFRFRLVEKTKKTKAKPREAPRRKYGFWVEEFDRDSYSNTYAPTGQLRLTVLGILEDDARQGYSIPLEKHFVDSPARPVESQLNEALLETARMLARLQQKEAEIEATRRRYRLEWERQLELRRQQELATKRLKELEGLAERHARASRLRLLIAAVEESGVVPGPPGSPENLKEWLAWARTYADQLDPVSSARNQ